MTVSEQLTITDYEETLADHRRLVRELDVLLNGDGAAEQASLCDIAAQLNRERVERALPVDYEWLKAIGGPRWRIANNFSRSVASDVLIGVEDGNVFCVLEASLGYGTETPIGNTRGDVLDLLKVFGVTPDN